MLVRVMISCKRNCWMRSFITLLHTSLLFIASSSQILGNGVTRARKKEENKRCPGCANEGVPGAARRGCSMTEVKAS